MTFEKKESIQSIFSNMSSSQQLQPPRDSSDMSEQEKDREALIKELYEISDMPEGSVTLDLYIMWGLHRERYLTKWGVSHKTGCPVPQPIPYTMCYGSPLPDILSFDVMSV